MSSNKPLKGPIAVGAVGGSGTRVIAAILKKLGFYIGNDLNISNDNLWFTLLFKRPRWFRRAKHTEILRAFSIFERIMTGSGHLHAEDWNFILRAAITFGLRGHDPLGTGRGLWPVGRLLTLARSKKPDSSQYVGWGWKEPNTHIYLKYIAEYFGNLKYIHVLRHGLDMAYSGNQAQLYNWGSLLGVPVPDSPKSVPKASLQYWNESNNRTIALGRKLLKDRFLIVNFDQLNLNPQHEIAVLMGFLGVDRKMVDGEELLSLIKVPASIGRYKKHDLSIFTRDEIEAVRKLGFVVDVP